MIDSPSGRVPEKASRWDRGRIEAYGGGRVFSSGSLLVSGYLRIYRSGIRSNGATRAPQGIALWRLREPYGLLSKSPGSPFSRKKSPKSFMAFGLRLVLLS